MFVESHRLVRPGREDDVTAALAARRRMNVTAVVAGLGAWVFVLIIGYAVVLPLVATQAPEAARQPLVWIAPFGAAAIVGLLFARSISAVGERRWERIKTDPELTRDGYAFFDAYGTVPGSIPAQDLWDALDAPGGVTSSPVHARIMAALRDERPAP